MQRVLHRFIPGIFRVYKACLFLLLSLVAPTSAETLTIGTASITYETPQGFSRADALFPLQLEELDKKFGMRTVVFAKYVPTAYLAIRETDSEALPDWYLHLTYDEKFSRLPLNRAAFVTTTVLLDKVIGHEYTTDDFKKKLEDVFRHAIGRNLTIVSMTQKGFMEKRDKARSMLATGHAVIEGRTGSLDFPIATLTTFVLEQRKLIAMVQIGRIRSDADLPAFTQQALDRVSQMLPSTGQTRSQ